MYIMERLDNCYITYEDPRYPTLIVEDEDGTTHGYCVSLRDGSVRSICICGASYEDETCICGYKGDYA